MQDGIILIDKEIGMTSRQVDNAIGRLFHTHHVGHLGTLDPFASGLLVVCLNKGGKFLPYLEGGRKTYRATLRLGTSTSTGDPTGQITETLPVKTYEKSEIEGVLVSFLGRSVQIPPMTSAIKIDGTALYKLAHKGEEIERKGREIEVHSISLDSYGGDEVSFTCGVSSGTYVRVLGEDIAKKLGTIGHLTSLRRTSVGKMDVKDAHKLEEVDEGKIIDPSGFVELPRQELNEQGYKMALNGMKLRFNRGEERLLVIYQGKAIAIYERMEEGRYKSIRGLF